ncbi:hypothetical protein CIT292_08865 [Citrobacter youngae ATCC 29220]|uniref:Uncharacterized protein n=1 Tax=Citrobacter youngae ATCC 29220 TaxID=500640 RepID=D4BED2_9ENTR|nr:hypothetical protein CIT292_08865 [Citrobacter youngae ATCC 29220]
MIQHFKNVLLPAFRSKFMPHVSQLKLNKVSIKNSCLKIYNQPYK